MSLFSVTAGTKQSLVGIVNEYPNLNLIGAGAAGSSSIYGYGIPAC